MRTIRGVIVTPIAATSGRTVFPGGARSSRGGTRWQVIYPQAA